MTPMQIFATATAEQIKLGIWTEDTWLLILYLILNKTLDTLIFHSQTPNQLYFPTFVGNPKEALIVDLTLIIRGSKDLTEIKKVFTLTSTIST